MGLLEAFLTACSALIGAFGVIFIILFPAHVLAEKGRERFGLAWVVLVLVFGLTAGLYFGEPQ